MYNETWNVMLLNCLTNRQVHANANKVVSVFFFIRNLSRAWVILSQIKLHQGDGLLKCRFSCTLNPPLSQVVFTVSVTFYNIHKINFYFNSESLQDGYEEDKMLSLQQIWSKAEDTVSLNSLMLLENMSSTIRHFLKLLQSPSVVD